MKHPSQSVVAVGISRAVSLPGVRWSPASPTRPTRRSAAARRLRQPERHSSDDPRAPRGKPLRQRGHHPRVRPPDPERGAAPVRPLAPVRPRWSAGAGVIAEGECDVADGIVIVDRVGLGEIDLPAGQGSSPTCRHLGRTGDGVVGGEDGRIGPLGLGDGGEGLIVRRLGADPDDVGRLHAVGAGERRFQRPITVVVDDAVEEQAERSVGPTGPTAPTGPTGPSPRRCAATPPLPGVRRRRSCRLAGGAAST